MPPGDQADDEIETAIQKQRHQVRPLTML